LGDIIQSSASHGGIVAVSMALAVQALRLKLRERRCRAARL